MTEDEAKTKWCPHSRSWDEAGPANRGQRGQITEGDLCIASQCMAWRTMSSQHGYCGLAGRPRV